MEKDVIKLICNYYYITIGKLNDKDELGLLFILSYIKLFKSESYEIAFRRKTKNVREFIDILHNSPFDPGSESRDPKNMDFIYDELEKMSYSFDNIYSLIALYSSVNQDVAKEIFKVNLESICRVGRGIEYTPKNINEVSFNILNVKPNDKILDIGSALGDFLVHSISKNNDILVSGIEINEYFYKISKLRISALTNNYNLINRDLFDVPMDEKYNKIFCNYPWGFKMDKMRLDRITSQMGKMLFDWKKTPGSSMDWLFINSMLTMLGKGGKAIAIIPDGPLFKTADNEYKMDLIKSGYIESIIKLPSRILPHTAISSNLVVFSEGNERIKFIDASKAVSGDIGRPQLDLKKIDDLLNKDKDENIGYADNDTIELNNYVLTVDYYLANSEIQYHNPKKLSDYIIDIFRGLQIMSSEIQNISDSNGEYEILTISDIEDGIISNNLTRINIENNKYDRYLIKNNDVIISSKGTRIKVAVAEIGDRKIIANGNLIVIRIDNEKLNPFYLAMYLLSKEGTTILNRIQTGSAIISINPGKLSEITISTLDINKQNQIAKGYQRIQQQLIFAKKHLSVLMREQEDYFDKQVVRMFDIDE